MSLPPVYLATINTPGYLPQDDETHAYDTAREAWQYLASERERGEDACPPDSDGIESGEYSDTYHSLVRLGDAIESYPGIAYGDTPGYDGDHDLGVAYSVTRVDHREYPHEAGYLVDCLACEARCHCELGHAECVYQGEHS